LFAFPAPSPEGIFKAGKQKQNLNLMCMENSKCLWTSCCYFLLFETEPSIVAHALAFLGWTHFGEFIHACIYHSSGWNKKYCFCIL